MIGPRKIPALRWLFPAMVLSAAVMPSAGTAAGEVCTYTTYTWNTEQGRAVGHRSVVKPRSELAPEEIHQETGCTVCAEDMAWISVPGAAPARVCGELARAFQSALEASVEAGEPVESLVGYRVGMTKGPVDGDGNRTRFSYHSYGIALDVNPGSNGLYTDCLTFGSQCRLLQGGPWDPGSPGSITADSVLVREMKSLGFRWGGEITGRQKDFMHFSPSGY